MGEVVVAFSGGKHRTAGGLDGPVNEMLHALPWAFVGLVRSVFNRRFRCDMEGRIPADAWRTFLATWIRKDSESDLLASFRPIMQSSVFLKWIERILLGPAPMQLIVHRVPLWGFRPRLSSSMLCFATAAAVKSLLQFNSPRNIGEGNVDGILLTVDVEKAFDKTTLGAQVAALQRIGFGASHVATLVSELLSSDVFVRLGDVEVGPVPHSRGKQGGCSTPFVFSAVVAALMEPLELEWQRRTWGIPLPGSDTCFHCAVFADNILLCGTSAQVVTMYSELTRALHRSSLNWKPSSFESVGPPGHVLSLPAIGSQPQRDLACQASVEWLGQPLSYAPDWEVECDACFGAATAAWNSNRKWLYNRRLTLRSRLRMFASAVVSVLVTGVCQLPCNASVLQRVRRWENRCLRSLVGLSHPFFAPTDFTAATRKARKISAKVGHVDVVTLCLRRHFALAGQWARLPADPGDLAIRDFQACWHTALTDTWWRLQVAGVRRVGPGRPRPCWDSLLHAWSEGKWISLAKCPSTWSDLEDDWIQWALARVGVNIAEIPPTVIRRSMVAPLIVDHASKSYTISEPIGHGVCVVTDSLVLARTMQGRWAARTPWLSSFVRVANDLCDALAQSVPLACQREGWWISHSPRRTNVWSDAVARFARDAQCPLQLWVHSCSFWDIWQKRALGGQWHISTDGSTRPEPPCARGLSGATCTLWHRSDTMSPVATVAASSPWAAAVESEATALQLALSLLQASSHVSAGFLSATAELTAVLEVDGLRWYSLLDLRTAMAASRVLLPGPFSAEVSMPQL